MLSRFSLFLLAAVAACGLLGGCRSEFHVILFNNTNDQIIFRRRAADPHPVVILSCTGGDVTDVSTDDVTIERNGVVYHYRYPAAYTYPSGAVSSTYEYKVRRLGKAYRLQLAPDNRIYLLQRRESYTAFQHSEQPKGFPLLPVQTEAVLKPAKKPKDNGPAFP